MFKKSDKGRLEDFDPITFNPKHGEYDFARLRNRTLDEAKEFIDDAIDLYGGGTVLHIVIQSHIPPWIRLELEADVKAKDAAKAKLTPEERKLLGL